MMNNAFDVNKFFDARRVVNEHTVESNKPNVSEIMDRGKVNPVNEQRGFPTDQPKQEKVDVNHIFGVPLITTKVDNSFRELVRNVMNAEHSLEGHREISTGRLNYETDKKLIERHPDLGKFCGAIQYIISNKLGLNVVVIPWLIVSPKNGFRFSRQSPGILSGYFAANIPEKSDAPIVFENENNLNLVIPNFMEKEMFLSLENNDIVIFPSWAKHRIEPNQADDNIVLLGFDCYPK